MAADPSFFVGDVDSDINDAGNWAATSGGAGGTGVPTATEKAIFDANSPNATVDAAFSWAVQGIEIQAGFAAILDFNDEDVDIGDEGFSLAAGTVNAGTGTISCVGDLVKTGGTFNHENGTVEINGGGSRAFNFPSADFFNLTFSVGASWTVNFTNTQVVTGTLTFAAGSNFKLQGTGKIQFQGDVIALGIMGTSSDIIIESTGTGTQDIFVDKAGGTGHLPGLVFSHSGTINLFDNLGLRGDGGFTHNSGTVAAGTSSITIFGSGNVAISIDAITLFDFVINNGGWTTTVTGDINVSNDLLITASNTTNGAGALKVGGDFTSNAAAIAGTLGIELNGTGAQTITIGVNDLYNGDFTINKASGTASLASNTAPASWTGDLIVTAGTLNLAGFDLNIGAQILDIDATLQLQGDETITATLAIDVATSTIHFINAAVEATVTSFAKDYFNLIVAADKVLKFATGAGNTTTVNGTFTSNGTATTQACLRSVTPSTSWFLDLQGASALGAGVDVQDSDASAGNLVSAIGSKDSLNNQNWDFGAEAKKVPGIVKHHVISTNHF